MADGYRLLHQSIGPSLSTFSSPCNTPDPDPPPPLPLIRPGMFSQNQQGHNSRLNGTGPRGVAPQLIYNGYLQNQSHGAIQQGLQHDTSQNASALGSHAVFGGSVMGGGASTFAPGGLQASHAGPANSHLPTVSANTSEFAAQQLTLYKDSEKAHLSMTSHLQQMSHSPHIQHHYYARIKASENKGIGSREIAAASEKELRSRQDWHIVDLSGQRLQVLSQPILSYVFLKEVYLVSNNLRELPPAIGQLRQLRYLNVSFNQLSEFPVEIGMCTFLEHLLAFGNKISHLPGSIGSLYNLEVLGMRGNPLQHSLDSILNERGTRALIEHLKETSPVPMPPEPPRIVVIQQEVSPSLERVRLLTWNVLCEKFATTNQYGYTPSQALDWSYRRELILSEIALRQADILTLQEIAMGAFKDFFEPKLQDMGYKSVYWPKQRARTMNQSEQQAVDGCATFFKADKYSLVEKHLVEFRTLAINRPDMKGQDDIFNRVMPKDNIATICLLKSRQSGTLLLVVNAHLAWEPHLADVKLIQTGILMETLNGLTEKYATAEDVHVKRNSRSHITEPIEGDKPRSPPTEYIYGVDIPMLICGDLNSTPHSSVYEFLTKGYVPGSHPDFDGRKYGNFTANGVQHPFNLRNAYECLNKTANELSFTNYTPGFDGVIDHIWFSANNLQITELLGPPDVEYLKRVPGFPHYHFPSDHIQLMAEFVIRPRRDKKALPEPDFPAGK